MAIIIHEHRKKKEKEQQLKHGETKQEVEESTKSSTGIRHMPILGGIVIALILIGLFALPMLMPSPMGGGGPPRQGGGGAPPPSSAGQLEPPQSQAPTQESAMDRGSST